MRLTWILSVVLALSIAPLCSASITGVPGGTAAPGPTLGPYFMTPFLPDNRHNENYPDVASPLGGQVSFDPLELRLNNNTGGWTAGAYAYTGKIYTSPLELDQPSSMTLTLPSDTVAFYFYATANSGGYNYIRATANGQSSSEITQETNVSSLANYYGFWVALDSHESLTTIALTVVQAPDDDTPVELGFTLGSFGIARRGGNVIVTDATGTTISFDTQSQSGQTTVTTSTPDETQGPPDDFMVGNPSTIFNISTTPAFQGSIIIGINYNLIDFINESELKLFHFDEDNQVWVGITTSLDMNNNMIYGTVSSLSAFAVFEPTIPNQSPMADAGPDQTVEGTSPAGASVTLDGSGSSDPDGDPLTYTWTWPGGSATPATVVNPTVTLSLGTTTLTLTVSDGQLSHTDTVDITVEDTTSPEITLLGDAKITLECGIDQYVELGATASDTYDPAVSAVIGGDTVDTSTRGTYIVTYDATDASGNPAPQVIRTVIVQDTTPPKLIIPEDVTVEQASHDGAVVSLKATATDACDPNPVITSDELEVYPLGVTVVTFTATDALGNSASCSMTVTVVPPEITVNIENAKVCWDHSDIHVAGKLYLPQGFWMNNLEPVGSAVVTLAGVDVADQSVGFEIAGRKDDKWEYKDKDNLDGNLKEFKIDWNGAKFDYKGADKFHIHTPFIGGTATTLCIHTGDVSGAFTVIIDGTTTIYYDAERNITTDPEVDYEPQKDDNTRVRFTLPFELTSEMTIEVEVSGAVVLSIAVANYYEEGFVKFKIVSAFDPDSPWSSSDEKLECVISLGDDIMISGSDLIDAWTKKDDKHWEYK